MYWKLSEAVTRLAHRLPEAGATESDLMRCGAIGLLLLRAGFYGRCYSPTAAREERAARRLSGETRAPSAEDGIIQAEGLYIVPPSHLLQIELTGSAVVQCAFRGPDVIFPYESITADRIRVLQSDLEKFASTIDRYRKRSDAGVNAAPDGLPSTKVQRSRNALAHAMDAGLIAYRKKHGTDPTARALFDWLGEHDQTKIIVGIEESEDLITWRRVDGGMKDTSFSAFQNRFTGLIRK